jgi:GT2 family glycosyltransferase
VLISLIVVNWNRRDLLRACLNSLRAQQGVEFEVILVDNGSTDGSPEMALAEFSASGSFHLQLIVNSRNCGFCEANNQGIAAARSQYIALLNNDAEAEPGWLAALARALDEDPDAGMAASKILVHEDPTRIDKVGHLMYPDGQNRGRGAGERDAGQYDRVERVLWPDGCAAMYRREMLDVTGPFDEDFFAYADDADLGLRGQIAGWSCVYAPTAVVRHHRGSTMGKGSVRRLMLIERNRILLVFKLFPWGMIALNPFYYVRRVLSGILASFEDAGETRHFPGWSGKLRMACGLLWGAAAAIPLIPKMIAKRKEVQKFRKRSAAEVRELLARHRISPRELNRSAT